MTSVVHTATEGRVGEARWMFVGWAVAGDHVGVWSAPLEQLRSVAGADAGGQVEVCGLWKFMIHVPVGFKGQGSFSCSGISTTIWAPQSRSQCPDGHSGHGLEDLLVPWPPGP